MKQTRVLGTRLDLIGPTETVKLIGSWLPSRGKKCRLVVTAYSEFYVVAQKDSQFKKVLDEADLVVPDGVGPLAAVKFIEQKPRNIIGGLIVGFDILRHNVGETVPGVWLFMELAKEAEKHGWRVFLLGGWNNVSSQATRMLLARFPNLKVDYDQGEINAGTDMKKDDEVVEKINKFKTDILFVSYNPVKQEKWIASHLDRLKVGVAIGVGGTFDELTGKVKPVPEWMSRVGLKWLGRLVQEPKRLRRIWNAVVVFPWLVYRQRGLTGKTI